MSHAENDTQQNLDDCATKSNLSEWIARTAKPEEVFVFATLTFKKERKIVMRRGIRKPARNPLVRNVRVLNGDIPTWKISSIENACVQNVRIQGHQRPRTLKNAARFAVAGLVPHYLPENEPEQCALRIVERLNKAVYKGRSRRRTNPERLTCVVGYHDLDDAGLPTRPHLHAVIGLPPHVTVEKFRTMLREASDREPFVYRRQDVAVCKHLRTSVDYAVNPDKSSTLSPVAYVYPFPTSNSRSTHQ